MRRRRRSRELHTVTLFPFLAVLICTFGVLIVLLVIVVKSADQTAAQTRAEHESDHRTAIEKKRLDFEMQQIRAEGYKTLQPELLKQLHVEKNQQAYLQSEIAILTNEVKLLNQRLQRAKTKSTSKNAREIERQIVQLKQRLEDEQDLLNKKRQSLAETKRETLYSVVPYSGLSGTSRKPIYIECRADGLELKPYGIKLGPRDFIDPVLPNNPLDAALIAVKEYYLKNNLLTDSESPYPLLIVRPDGPNAYALARHAMKSWDEEFGYELVGMDKVLDFGSPDLQLAEAMTIAVEAAKRRQKQFVAETVLHRANRDIQVTTANGMHASSQLGGFVNSQGRIQQASAEQGNHSTSSKKKSAESGNADSDAEQQADIAVRGIDSDQSLAREKGKDWALPSKSQGAIAYRRPVKVYLSDNELIVESDSQSNRREQIDLTSNPQESVELLVEAIWKRIESWGVAGTGGYWKPELDVVVLPGGDRQYRQLLTLLSDSGIELRENQQ